MSNRDRHERGLRGMLAPPRSLAGPRLRARRPTLASEFFVECVTETIDDVAHHCPEALAHVDIGVEEVPDVSEAWLRRVPLAVAREATLDRLAQVVLYRRPIEFRCSSRSQVRELVFTTIVEQLAQVTGIAVDRLDPDHHRSPDDDD
ncbi:MAG: metallopeptidase family protein [Propionibacteriaceae bacterium]|jgi:predicted Zn-dependent protease with MMP-like domain|nr:metallopeptidase family protein [Propionibacteriaceae bacterium]